MAGLMIPENLVFGLDIGTRSIVGTVGYKSSENDFTVVAQYTKFHETRAMLDGQIHDIEKVAETITAVKKELEKQIGHKLLYVCIAAAGRVLKTIQVHCDLPFEEETTITKEHIITLTAGGIEKAYGIIREETANEKITFNCVGHTVIHYYLDQYVMTVLDGHRGHSIAADIIATFLPQGVVDSLYAAIEKAGLTVVNITLEPIAAINVAIPEKYRMLNIALVDVGAGTSDISITKDGSIIAYGMIPCAGDAITEAIMNQHLVDFNTADDMKILSGKKKEITYIDILKLKNKVSAVQIIEETSLVIDKITKEIAERIIELNGGKSVSAVFVVGGGGKFRPFIQQLAMHLKLPKERVALRGEEVLGSVRFLQEDIKKDSTLVTPIGICLNYYEQKNNLIFVYVNEERIKLYDNSKLTIVDAALKYGFPNEKLFARRGQPLNFSLNGERRMIRGELGESAVITLNGAPASINSAVTHHDSIQITESTAGLAAKMIIRELSEYKTDTITFLVNDKKVTCPKLITANGEFVNDYYEIKESDEIILMNHYSLEKLLEYMDLEIDGDIYVNGALAVSNVKVYENFTVELKLFNDYKTTKNESRNDSKKIQENAKVIKVKVNQTDIVLTGKMQYVLVDILDFYNFDLSVARGTSVVLKVNGIDADFTQSIIDGDSIDLYWNH